jgi:hypothetical protein
VPSWPRQFAIPAQRSILGFICIWAFVMPWLGPWVADELFGEGWYRHLAFPEQFVVTIAMSVTGFLVFGLIFLPLMREPRGKSSTLKEARARMLRRAEYDPLPPGIFPAEIVEYGPDIPGGKRVIERFEPDLA